MGHGRRSRAIASTPHKLLLDPYARETRRQLLLGWGAPRRRCREPAAARRARQRRQRLEGARGERFLRLARRHAAGHALGRHGAVRTACAWLHQAAPGRARRAARQLCRPGLGRGPRAPEAPGHHRREPDAGAPLHRRRAAGAHGPAQPLGLQHAGLLLPRAALCQCRPCRRPRGARRVPPHGAAPARGRHRGDSRRGLQSHGRNRRVRPHAQLARAGQRQLLPSGRRACGDLREPCRLRQHARPAPAACAADW